MIMLMCCGACNSLFVYANLMTMWWYDYNYMSNILPESKLCEIVFSN